jgi:hypothetical protein
MRSLRLILSTSILLLLASIGSALACGCGSSSSQTIDDLVGSAMITSAVVFEGKVMKFEYRKGVPIDYLENDSLRNGSGYETMLVRFKVDRWWKGDLTEEFLLATQQARHSDGTGSTTSCEFNFKEDETYLVFAFWDNIAGMSRTGSCSLTRAKGPMSEEIVKILGIGTLPAKHAK